MGIQKAWSVTKGKGVVVGLLDTGVDGTHPDLKDALTPGEDLSGQGAANGEKAVSGEPHGTNMAGYIVGRGHGGAGMLGSAPEAKVMSVSYAQSGAGPTLSKGLRYLVDHGAKVINLSFDSIDGITAADIAYAEAHDVVVVAGTGNGLGSPPENPSTQFGVVSVTGLLKGLTKVASGASYGPPQIDKGATTTTGFKQGTAVAGPFANTEGNDDLVSLTTVADGTYARTSGTSNATAIVSGVVALIRAAHPDMDAANVINRLIRTASFGKSGSLSPTTGFGVPNAYAAVTSASIKTVCANPLGSEVTKSLGLWPALIDKSFVYKPLCGSSASSSPAPSISALTPSGEFAPASAAASSGGSSGGVPAWIYVLIAIAVLAAIGLVYALRGRGKRGGPGGPPGGPPIGGYGPPVSGPYGGPPQGGWQHGPPQQGGWQPGPPHRG